MHKCLLLVIFLFAVTVDCKQRRSLPAAKQDCAKISWVEPMQWFGGGVAKIQYSYSVGPCNLLTTRSDVYHCATLSPPMPCNTCPNGSVCDPFTGACTKCSTTPDNTTYQNATITVNDEEQMMSGQFWNIDSFYNDTKSTGADLIHTMDKWLWNPTLQVLHHDSAQQKVSAWGDNYDYDYFTSSSCAYDSYNSTHTRAQILDMTRWSYYNGKVNMDASSVTNYYPNSL